MGLNLVVELRELELKRGLGVKFEELWMMNWSW